MQTFPEFLMCLLYCFIPWQDVVIITLRVAGSVWKYSHPTFSPPASCLPLPPPASLHIPQYRPIRTVGSVGPRRSVGFSLVILTTRKYFKRAAASLMSLCSARYTLILSRQWGKLGSIWQIAQVQFRRFRIFDWSFSYCGEEIEKPALHSGKRRESKVIQLGKMNPWFGSVCTETLARL